MLSELRDFYDRSGIAAEAFRCVNAPRCQSACNEFVTACEAFVGSEYERGVLPRLLFISLDPASDLSDGVASHRALTYVREREEGAQRPVEGAGFFRRNNHWYQTFAFAHRLLSPIAEMRGLAPIPFERVNRYFAHTNSAKCKDPSRGSPQGRAILFRSCSQFIPGEVLALQPDVVVTQGLYARAALRDAFPVLCEATAPADAAYRCQVLAMGGREVLKISMHHPKARRGAYQREVRYAWEWYLHVAHAFVMGDRSPTQPAP